MNHCLIESESEPIPYSVPSSTTAAPQQHYQHHHYGTTPAAPAMVTPPTASKAVISESVIGRVGGATSVVEATPPTVPRATVKATPSTSTASRKRSYSMAAAPEPTTSAATAPVDTSKLSFQEQEDLRRYVLIS